MYPSSCKAANQETGMEKNTIRLSFKTIMITVPTSMPVLAGRGKFTSRGKSPQQWKLIIQRHVRDYQKSVHSSRIRYERNRHSYNQNRSSDYYGTQNHYSNNQRSSSRGSTSYSLERSSSRHSTHSSSRYSTSRSTKERGSHRSPERYGSR